MLRPAGRGSTRLWRERGSLKRREGDASWGGRCGRRYALEWGVGVVCPGTVEGGGRLYVVQQKSVEFVVV